MSFVAYRDFKRIGVKYVQVPYRPPQFMAVLGNTQPSINRLIF
jgi:hypothetical protein